MIAALRPTAKEWRLAARDAARGVSSWQMWMLLGVSDIRQRYNRSRVGQFWITLSMAVFIGSIGLVYSLLFKQPIREYIPFLAVNFTIWTLISGIFTESSTVFVQAAHFLRQDSLPKTIFVLRTLLRNLIAFAHNLLIIPVVFALFGVVPSPLALLAVPGLALLLIASFHAAIVIGVLCTRFRDLPQIVQNLVQIAFFVTPVVWRVDQMGDASWYVAGFNPFAAFLRIVAEPIQGHVPSLSTYANALISTALVILIAWPLFARFRARIVYWL